jgi:hypothetical protein
MGFLSRGNKESELAIVFDIGSSSVGAAFFRTEKSGVPRMVFSVREFIPIEDSIDINRFLLLTLKALESVVLKAQKSGLGAPSRFFCVLSAPWFDSQTRTITLEKNTPFIFNEKLADSLIQKEIALFEEEHKEKYNGVESKLTPIELKNMKIMLNGYEIEKPLNQKTKELEMTIFISMSPEYVLAKITETVAKGFHFKDIKFSSFATTSFTLVRDLFINQEDFLLVDIGGEITYVSMVKKDILRESVSFPIGRNFILRGVAISLGCTIDEAVSLFSLYSDGHASTQTHENIDGMVKDLKKEWLKQFQESLPNLSHDISIPSTIFITVDEKFSDFFIQTIKEEQFNQYTLTDSKFTVNFLGVPILHDIIEFEAETKRDATLAIEIVYINRFLI